MSRAGQFKTPAQILPKHLKWQEDVVVPEHFSADEIVQLKKFARMAGDEASGYEPVYLSCWNGQPTLRDDGYVKLNMESSSSAFHWHSKQISGPPLCPIS
jgi:hypothetical protein